MFVSASISGGISNGVPSSSSGRFMDKFSAVADATREVELLGGGLGSLSIGSTSNRVPSSSRRTSFLSPEGIGANKPFLESSPGSLNESLNNTLNQPQSSTRQSISEKIDNYLSNSPVQSFNGQLMGQKSRSGSFASDVNHSEHNSIIFEQNKKGNTNSIWNTQKAASAAIFTPMSPQNVFPVQFMPNGFVPPHPQMFPYGFPFNQFNGMVPMGSPPLGYLSPVPPQAPGMFPTQPSESEESKDETKNSGESTTGESTTGESTTGEKDTSTEKPQIHGPQPKRPDASQGPQQFSPPGPGSPPFMYPQAFSPFGFVPQFGPSNSPMPPQLQQPQGNSGQPPQNFSPMAQAPNGNNGNNGFPSKRNNKSPKNSSPSSRNGPSKGPKNQIYRSPVLEEFRNNTTKEYTLKDIFGNAIEFSKDQHGSRFIQQQLSISSTNATEKEVIFNEIREDAMNLITDVFGNYVIQKYFEHGTPTQRVILLSIMKGQIKQLSLQMYGCRVIQRAIEHLPLESQIEVITELKNDVIVCIKDQNGNHVIQKSIECIPIDKIAFILDSLKTQIYHLSTHPYGCRVIQRLLEYSSKEDQDYILAELSKFTYFLIQDQYGNYVIQHIIENGSPKDKTHVIETVSGSVVEFSKHKFASNVVEKCVVNATVDQRITILEEVLQGNSEDNDDPVDDQSSLGLMMKDQFANYVVQKLVEISKGPKKRLLIRKIKVYLKQIARGNYGKHLASIEKLIVLSENAVVSDEE